MNRYRIYFFKKWLSRRVKSINVFLLRGLKGFPNVLLEALACGLPVISTDCRSGPRELLAPDTEATCQLKGQIELAKYGILVPVGDAERMSEAMRMIMADEKLRNRYRKRARERIKDFEVGKVLSTFLSTFLELN